MKVQSDKKRSDVSFQVGDKVFLKLQSYIQSSLARRSTSKTGIQIFWSFTDNREDWDSGLSVGFTSKQHHSSSVSYIAIEKKW
jgi:hypothetical protein